MKIFESYSTFISTLVFKFLYDVFCFTISSFLAFYIRFDLSINTILNYNYLRYILILSCIELTLGVIFVLAYNTYRYKWLYTSSRQISEIIKIVFFEKLILTFITYAFSTVPFPSSIFLISFFITLILLIAPRLYGRLDSEKIFNTEKKDNTPSENKLFSENNTLIIGTGDIGENIVKEVTSRSYLGYNIKGFVDNDLKKIGCYIHGIKILGNLESIPKLVKKHNIKTIIIAIPNSKRTDLENIYKLFLDLPIKLLILPSNYKIAPEKGELTISHLRPFSVSDLLFGEPKRLITEKSISRFNSTRVLVTGATGTIGCSICKNLIELKAEVIALDNNESGLYMLYRDLNNKGKFYPVVGDIRFKDRLLSVFNEYKPDIIFHTAAYKHMPLMEIFPEESIANNILGTFNIIEACIEANITQCIALSSDLAMNQDNFIGVTKRINELMLLSANENNSTKFSVIRLGNLLDSRGNVLEVWENELKNGKPLSITDINIKKNFMITDEASSLIIEASTIANGGEILLLNICKEISIVELAEAFCKIHSTSLKKAGTNIIGLRAGEKLEDVYYSDKPEIIKTDHDKILRIQYIPKMSWREIKEKVNKLTNIQTINDKKKLLESLKEIVSLKM